MVPAVGIDLRTTVGATSLGEVRPGGSTEIEAIARAGPAGCLGIMPAS